MVFQQYKATNYKYLLDFDINKYRAMIPINAKENNTRKTTSTSNTRFYCKNLNSNIYYSILSLQVVSFSRRLTTQINQKN